MKKRNYLTVLFALISLSFIVIAAKPLGITQLTSLWIGDATQTATVTPGVNDLYVAGTVEVDGAARFDGAVTVSTTDGLSAAAARGFDLPLAAAYVDAAGVITTATTPDLPAASTDGLPVIIYTDSSETTLFGWTFTVPPDYSSGLSFRVLMTSDSDTSYASWGIDWVLYVNAASGTIDATPYNQTHVFNAVATPSASNAELTLTPGTASPSSFSAGDVVTAYFWNYDQRSGAAKTTEIKRVQVRYTAAR